MTVHWSNFRFSDRSREREILLRKVSMASPALPYICSSVTLSSETTEYPEKGVVRSWLKLFLSWLLVLRLRASYQVTFSELQFPQ